MSGLSLESLMAIAQSASSAAARRAQQAQQAQAQQAQQQQNQQGVNGAQGAQGQQNQQPQMSAQDLESAQERNSTAGETWGEFKSDTPVEQNKATAENQNREDLYKDLGAAKAAVSCPTSDNAADTAAKDALKKPTAIETAAKDIKQPSTTTAVDAAAARDIKQPSTTAAVQAAAKEAIKNPTLTTAADAAAKEAIKQPNTTSAVEAAAQALGSNAGAAAAAAAGAATANPVQAAASTTTPAQTPAATTTPAQTPTETPAASPTPAATPAATPAQTPASQPQFKTNQDLINYAYKQGGGTWEGASRVAREHGTSLNALVRDRNGTPPVSSPRTGGTESAPGTTPSTPGATPGTDAARASGANRPIKGYRDVDVNKLAEQLPPQAKHLAQAFVDSGKKHNVDPIALAAIAKHETGNFTSSAFRNKNNAMGVSDANGPVHQASHEASIDKMARLLGSTSSGPYKNASTVGEIGRIYAPVGAGNDPTGLNNHWTRGVSNFADDLEKKVVGSSSPASTNASSTNASAPSTNTSSAPSTSSASPTARPQGTGSTTTSGANAANEPPATTSGANGTARIESTKNAGARNQMVEGTITVNGNSYPFRSGGHGRGSLPTGTYTVERHLDSRSDRSMSVGGVGYSFAVSDKFDPRVGANRSLLRIHPDGGSAGTEGCIGIVGDAATQRRFRDDMLAEIRRNGGRYTLTVG